MKHENQIKLKRFFFLLNVDRKVHEIRDIIGSHHFPSENRRKDFLENSCKIVKYCRFWYLRLSQGIQTTPRHWSKSPVQLISHFPHKSHFTGTKLLSTMTLNLSLTIFFPNVAYKNPNNAITKRKFTAMDVNSTYNYFHLVMSCHVNAIKFQLLLPRQKKIECRNTTKSLIIKSKNWSKHLQVIQ